MKIANNRSTERLGLSAGMGKKLVQAAIKARKNAYCPYSKYQVGASVLSGSGKIYTGCNVENASLGLSCCAERNAIFHAASCGERKIRAVCVAAKSATPCGACRQVMAEFMDEDGVIILVNASGAAAKSVKYRTMGQMLPECFNPAEAGL